MSLEALVIIASADLEGTFPVCFDQGRRVDDVASARFNPPNMMRTSGTVPLTTGDLEGTNEMTTGFGLPMKRMKRGNVRQEEGCNRPHLRMRLEFVSHGCIDGRSSQKGDRSLGWSLASLVMKRVREEWPMKQPVARGSEMRAARCLLSIAILHEYGRSG